MRELSKPSGAVAIGGSDRTRAPRADGPAELRRGCRLLLAVVAAVGCQNPQGEANGLDADASPAAGSTKRMHAIGVGAVRGRPGYENVLRGLELAVERLNGTGAAHFAIRLPDSGTVSAVRIAEQLRDDVRVIAVVGHPESGQSIEAAPVYADAEHDGKNAVVAISPTASSPRLSGISPWFFRLAPSDEEAARFVARWVHDSLQARRAAIVYRNDSYGRDWASTFTASFGRDGATIVSRDPYLAGITEWDAYAERLAVLEPDVLLFPGDAGEAVELLRALHRARVHIPFIGGDGTAAMRDSSIAAGARYVAFFHPDRVETDEGRTFVRLYTAKYGEAPDMFAALSYDAALVIGRSVISGATTRPALRRAIEGLGAASAPALEGAGGRITFEKNHDIAGRTVMIATVPDSAGRP